MKADLFASRLVTTGAVSTILLTLMVFVARIASLGTTDCFQDGNTWVAQDCSQDPVCSECALSVCEQFAAGDDQCELSCGAGAWAAHSS